MARHRTGYSGELLSKTLTIKLTPKDRTELSRQAASSGLSVSAYVRAKITGGQALKAVPGRDPRAMRALAIATIGGGGTSIGELPPIDPAEDRDRFLRLLAELKSKEPPAIRMKRWTGALRDPIDVPSPKFLELFYDAVPAADREWFYVHEERIHKLEMLRAQLGVKSWWHVVVWFAKRHVPGFKIAPRNSKRRISWRQLRIFLYKEVNAHIDWMVKAGEGRERRKIVEEAIARLKKFGPPVYHRITDVTLRKQYYLAKAEMDAKTK